MSTKISQLPSAAPLSSPNFLVVVQGGVTKKTTVGSFLTYIGTLFPNADSTTTGLLTSTDWNTFNSKQDAITLSVSGTSGASTFIGNTLTIPQYQGSLTLTTTGTSGSATLIGDTLNIPNYADNGITSINTLTSLSQSFAIGSSGTDFNISSALSTHTFNIPNASSGSRGLLKASDWSTFNSKEPALTKGNLTEATSSVLTITGGSTSVIGSGTSIQVKQSSSTQSGFLSSTDWNTFNSKQGSLTLTTSGTSGSATLVGNTLNIPVYVGGSVTSVTAQSPLSSSGGTTPDISIQLASADSLTIGASTFFKDDFNDDGFGLISIDYAGGQLANSTQNGFLKSSDYTSFNSKQSALSGTGIVKSVSGTISYLTDNSSNWDSAYTNRISSLTTTGTSGAATLVGNTLNIPNYSSGGGGITTLNTLTDTTQTFAVGTSGTNFNISSATGTHTFNIPDASATARGVVTTGTQTFAGIKTFSSPPKITGLVNGYLLYPASDGTLSSSSAYFIGTNSQLSVGSTTNSYGKLQVIAGTLPTTVNQLTRGIHCTLTNASTYSYLPRGLHIEFTTAGTQANASYPLRGSEVSMNAGYTGSITSVASFNNNAVAGTASSIVASGNTYGNQASYNFAGGTTTGSNQGVVGYARAGDISIGGVFRAGDTTISNNKAAAKYIGCIGIARNDTSANSVSLGGYFGLNTTDPTFANAALIADNADAAYDIFVARDNGTAKWSIADGGNTTWGDAVNIVFNATTGTKIGTATSQKLSFWNATPIIQPTTGVASATVTSLGAGNTIKTDDTFDGYTLQQVVKALRNIGILA